MYNNTMFTVNEHFMHLNAIVDSLRHEHRAVILKLVKKIIKKNHFKTII
jgi:hypothetical protein